MLKNIKSTYFSKIVFSYLEEKIKLKMVKYNKAIQKLLNIKSINYRIFSRKYIIYEPNGKGKEYNYDDDLLFEGEYLNRKRNGKGKEYSYFSHRLLFDGEYLNGKRNGKGKEYDHLNFKLIDDGEYLNGKRNGKGKEYNFFGELSFVGEFFNGKRWIGKEYDKKGKMINELKYLKNGYNKVYEFGTLIFEGEYLNGLRNGKGKEFNNNIELIFEGKYLNGERHKGKEYSGKEVIFEGDYLDGKKWNGKVKEKLYGRVMFKGEYFHGKRWN